MPEHHCTHKKDRESPRRRYYNDPDRIAAVNRMLDALARFMPVPVQRQEEIKELPLPPDNNASRDDDGDIIMVEAKNDDDGDIIMVEAKNDDYGDLPVPVPAPVMPDICTICQEPANDELGPLSAQCDQGNEPPGSAHFFHEQCLDQWVRSNPPASNECPNCRGAPCRDLGPGINFGLFQNFPHGGDQAPIPPGDGWDQYQHLEF